VYDDEKKCYTKYRFERSGETNLRFKVRIVKPIPKDVERINVDPNPLIQPVIDNEYYHVSKDSVTLKQWIQNRSLSDWSIEGKLCVDLKNIMTYLSQTENIPKTVDLDSLYLNFLSKNLNDKIQDFPLSLTDTEQRFNLRMIPGAKIATETVHSQIRAAVFGPVFRDKEIKQQFKSSSPEQDLFFYLKKKSEDQSDFL
jgi:hypothetical protein